MNKKQITKRVTSSYTSSLHSKNLAKHDVIQSKVTAEMKDEKIKS